MMPTWLCRTGVLLLPCPALLACASQRPSSQQAGVQQVSFPQAARDRLRGDLSRVIVVVRRPARPESTWVALVRKDAPDTTAIVRFNTAAPYFLTWLLGNTRLDQKVLLASLPATAPAQAILNDSLVAGSLFTRTVIVSLGLFRGTARTTGRREFLFDSLVTFATRYFRLELDSA